MTISMTNLNNKNTEIIIGNPGCGKTTELIRRLAAILRTGKISVNQIGFCSFSVAAVEEILTRTSHLMNELNSQTSSCHTSSKHQQPESQEEQPQALSDQQSKTMSKTSETPSKHAKEQKDQLESRENSNEECSSSKSQSSPKLFDASRKNLQYFRTMHSLSFLLLGLSKDSLITEHHLKEFGRMVNLPMSGATLRRNATTTRISLLGDLVMQHIDTARQRNITIRAYAASLPDLKNIPVDLLEEIAESYKNYKAINNLFDYTDMLTMALHNDYELPQLEYLFIDEAQDMSPVMWALLNKLAGNTKHIIIAGDDKQSINEYSAADVDTFLQLPGKVTVLEQSHRVPKAVFNLANKVVKKMQKYRPEGAVWRPREEEGMVRSVVSFPATEVVAGKGTTMVLTRSRSQAKPLAEKLLSMAPMVCPIFTVHGEPPVDMDIFRLIALFKDAAKTGYDLKNYVTLSETDSASTRKQKIDYIKLFKKFISCDTTAILQPWELTDMFLEKLKLPWYRAMDRLQINIIHYCKKLYPLYEKKGKEMFNDAKIRLMTIHASKGREADNVFVCTDVPRQVKDTIQFELGDSEAKVLYVAITRAKKRLFLFGDMYQRFSLRFYL